MKPLVLILLLSIVGFGPETAWTNSGDSASAKGDGLAIVGERIIYSGVLDRKKNQKLFAHYKNNLQKPRNLIITSHGGDVIVGMELGEWVLEHALDVHIPTLCASSCANYVFTAGRRVTLGAHALVYWHGSPIIDDLFEGTMREQQRWRQIRRSLDLNGFEGSDPKAYWRRVRKRNRQFFDAAGVSPLITVAQFVADQDSHARLTTQKITHQMAYSLSLEDIAVFGRKNVSIDNNQTWEPDGSEIEVGGLVRINLVEDAGVRIRKILETLPALEPD